MSQPRIVLIVGGVANLCAACFLYDHFDVTIYEKGKTLGRKFLVAGKGGFNLTNELDGEDLLAKYRPQEPLKKAILNFGSADTRKWLHQLGIETFIGSSGRVFPTKGIKPAAVLKSILKRLQEKKVQIKTNHEFLGWSGEKEVVFQTGSSQIKVQADAFIFALGGGSWSKTGANSKWLKIFQKAGVGMKTFQASKCGLNISWDETFKEQFEGNPLKNISIKYGDKQWKGEALITHYGVEGNMIYPLSDAWREYHKTTGDEIYVDFKPNNTTSQLIDRLGQDCPPKKYRDKLNLPKPLLHLVKWSLSKKDYQNNTKFVEALKSFPLKIDGLRNKEESISTVGGLPFEVLNKSFELVDKPNHFAIGEMVDWDAPTGGYLLQGCFSMGNFVAQTLNKKYEHERLF